MTQRDIVGGSEGVSVGRSTNAGAQGVSFGQLIAFVVTLAAGGAAGTDDDVDVFADGGAFGSGKAPVGFEIVDVHLDVDTVAANSTIMLSSAPGGAGTSHTDVMDTDVAGIVREPTGGAYIPAAHRIIAPGDELYVHRNDRSVTGRVTIIARSVVTE